MRVAAAVAACALLVLADGGSARVAASPSRALVTGVADPEAFSSPNAAAAFRRVKATGATTVVVAVNWADVAPGGVTRPAGFDAADPDDSLYHWNGVDRQVRLAVRAGLEPIVVVSTAPRWAQPLQSDVAWQPDPTAFGQFARAIARRFDGHHGLPRVRYWQAWNEPNLTTFLRPQYANDHPYSPGWYRRMLNAFAASVHGVARDNLVIGGGLAPFADRGVQVPDWGPLTFMRLLLCLSDRLKPTCQNRVSFDAWSTHPYTSGGPQHHANRADDVSLGDLGEMRAVLRAAERYGHIRSSTKPVEFWVTEFGWDSAPPDPNAVPMDTLRQWIPQALRTMWANGITHVVWFSLRDDHIMKSPFQSGLYFNGGSFAEDRPKPILANFRFPVVVEAQARGIFVWGRTPAGVPGAVTIETTTPGGWRRVGGVVADANGIFRGVLPLQHLGQYVRAKLGKDASGRVPVIPIPDRFYNPFGTTPPPEGG